MGCHLAYDGHECPGECLQAQVRLWIRTRLRALKHRGERAEFAPSDGVRRALTPDEFRAAHLDQISTASAVISDRECNMGAPYPAVRAHGSGVVGAAEIPLAAASAAPSPQPLLDRVFPTRGAA